MSIIHSTILYTIYGSETFALKETFENRLMAVIHYFKYKVCSVAKDEKQKGVEHAGCARWIMDKQRPFSIPRTELHCRAVTSYLAC